MYFSILQVNVEAISAAFGDAIVTRLDKAVEPAKKKRAKNGVVPGKAVISKHLKKISYETDKIWYCCACNIKWTAKDTGEWIVCDTCSRVYHFECTDAELEAQQTIADINFNCVECC